MILSGRCSTLFKTTTMCISTYSKMSTLLMYNLFMKQYFVLSCSHVTKPCTYKCNTRNARNFSVNSDRDEVETFQHKMILLQKSINNQNVEDLLHVIDDLENNDYDLQQNVAKMILKCGKMIHDVPIETRQELMNRVWSILERRKHDLTIDHYHALLHAYIDNKCAINPNEFLRNMTVKPEYDTYCLLSKALSNVGDYESIETYIAELREKQIPLTEEIYSALICAYTINGNVAKAKEVINSIEKLNIQPSSKTRVQLMFTLATNDNVEDLATILETTTVSISDITELMKLLSLSNNGSYLLSILKFMQPLQKLEADVMSLVVQLVHAGHSLDAYTIVSHIPISPELKEVKKSLALHLIKEMIQLNIDQKILLKVVGDFATEQDMEYIWKNAIQLALQANNAALALRVLEEMKGKGIIVQSHDYLPLFVHLRQNGNENDFYVIMRHMVASDVNIDSCTFIYYVLPYINTSDPILTINKMKSIGLPCIDTIAKFVVFLLNEQRLPETIKLCTTFRYKVYFRNMLDPLILNYKALRDIDQCIQFLFKLSVNGHYFVGEFLKKFVDHIQFELCDITNLIKFLNTMEQNKTYVSSRNAMYVKKKILDMNLNKQYEEYIFCTLDNLIRNKDTHNYNSEESNHLAHANTNQLDSYSYVPKRKTNNIGYTIQTLLLDACKENNVKQVNKFVAEMNSNNAEWSLGVKMTLFNFYQKHGEIDKALHELQEMQSLFAEPQIYNYKILNCVLILLQQNKIEKAFEILETCTSINHKTDGRSKCMEILQLLVHSNYFNYTEKMINILVRKGYCTMNSFILRWLIILPIIRNDIKSAVNEFKRCIKVYNSIPAKQELLTELVKRSSESPQEYNELLNEVYNLILNALGNKRACSILAISLAQCNKIDELKNLFKKEDLCEKSLLRRIKYLKEDEIMKVSSTILKAVAETSKVDTINRAIANKL